MPDYLHVPIFILALSAAIVAVLWVIERVQR